jgi:aryl-alcohol dehydrogenase-like predicted oxidoreductase
MASCEQSLKRLGTDYLDLYIAHSFDFVTPLEETLRALDDLVRHGKVRYLGCSNFAAWQLMKALAISDKQNFETTACRSGSRKPFSSRSASSTSCPYWRNEELS